MNRILYAKGKNFLHKKGDMHTQYGYIRETAINSAKPGAVLETNTGTKMTVLDAGFMDKYAKIKRGAQIIPLKDLGGIIVKTGMDKTSVVVEAGSGSGASGCFMAHISKKVTTYEVREDFAKIVQHNIEWLELKNIKLKNKDVYKGITEKNVDIILFDLPEPWKAVPHAASALRPGGFLVNYSPTLPQVSDFVKSLGDAFLHLKTTETIEREWEIDGRKIRPKSQPIGHSGFLTFCRKI